AWRQALLAQGVGVTEIRERKYFQSIYFREPGGVLFEIAPDAPGFAVDEPVDALGTQWQLPPWLEAQRDEIARRLPPIVVPAALSD
ncbi:diguanylate cyclase, partial [Kouleothrix aurantiaca]